MFSDKGKSMLDTLFSFTKNCFFLHLNRTMSFISKKTDLFIQIPNKMRYLDKFGIT